MSDKLECVAGVYDNSAGLCRPYEDVDAYSASEAGVNKAGENNEGPCSIMENSQTKRYADIIGNRDNLVFHKQYWINESGVITDTLFDVVNRRGNAGVQAWREWRWAERCTELENDILNGVRVWRTHTTQECFKSFDLVSGRYERRFNPQWAGQPPPDGWDNIRVFDASNDRDTDWVEGSMFSRGVFDNVACALALFDSIWNDESLPASYTYVPDFTPGALQVYVKEGDEVRKGDKLFAFKSQEPYRTEVDGEVSHIGYYRQGTQMSLTVDRADKSWWMGLLGFFR